MSDRKQELDKYVKENSEWPPLSKKEVPEYLPQKKEYNAVKKPKQVGKIERFQIIDKDGNFDLYSYTHLLEISYRNNALIIATTQRNFILWGEGLTEIAELLSERKVEAIREYSPETHRELTSEHKIVIKKLERGKRGEVAE